MKNLKEHLDKYMSDPIIIPGEELSFEEIGFAYRQGFIDATKLAAKNGTVTIANAIRFVDEQSILKAIEE